MRQGMIERLEGRCLLSVASDIGLIAAPGSGAEISIDLSLNGIPRITAAVVPTVTGHYSGESRDYRAATGGAVGLTVTAQVGKFLTGTVHGDGNEALPGTGKVNARGKLTFNARGYLPGDTTLYAFKAKGQVSADGQTISGTYVSKAGRLVSKGTFAVSRDAAAAA